MSTLDSLALTRIPPADEALRAEVRAFLAEAIQDLPAHVRARSWGGYSAELSRKLGAKGWIGVTLPKEYGGGGAAPSRAMCWWRSFWPAARPWARTGSRIGRARR